jgi:hypothetical protein
LIESLPARLKTIYADLSHLSVFILIAANLVPLYGVLFIGWRVFPLLFLYWFENVIIGMFNVLKMLTCNPGPKNKISKIAVIPFFCVHYGLFTLVHGIFIFVMFGGEVEVQSLWSIGVGWAVLDLFVSHGISFAINYIKGGEYKRTNLNKLMQEPYGRVVIMHLTIIGGGFLMTVLQSPVAGLIMLVLIKIVLDLRAHVSQHFRNNPEEIVIAAKS